MTQWSRIDAEVKVPAGAYVPAVNAPTGAKRPSGNATTFSPVNWFLGKFVDLLPMYWPPEKSSYEIWNVPMP